jgi:hypothetical protein
MIFKTQNVRASKYTQAKATSFLGNHLKYLQYRDRAEQESRADRLFFNAQQEGLNWRPVAKEIMQEERAGDIYFHRMVFAPADDEPVPDWQAWTRALMSDLEKRLGKSLNWYAVHHQNTAHPHMHVIMRGTGIDRETGRAVPVTLNPQDFKFLREKGREHSEYENQRFLEQTLRELHERDSMLQELELIPGERGPQQHERDISADFDR